MQTEPQTSRLERNDRRTFMLIVVVVVLLGGLAANNYAANERSAERLRDARVTIDLLEDEHASLTADADVLSADLDGMTSERDDLAEQLDETTALMNDAVATAEALADERDDALAAKEAAEARAVALREQYDPAIRAERQAMHDAAIAADCDASVTAGAIRTPSWDADFASLDGVTQETYRSAVDACAAPAIAQGIRGRCQDPVDVEQVVRDPDAHIGDCVELVVEIVQFDQATGPCAFRAYFDTTPHRWSFDYKGDNGIFAAAEPCPFLTPVGVDDVVRVWAEIRGELSYSTTIGGTSHAVSFRVLAAELITDN